MILLRDGSDYVVALPVRQSVVEYRSVSIPYPLNYFLELGFLDQRLALSRQCALLTNVKVTVFLPKKVRRRRAIFMCRLT